MKIFPVLVFLLLGSVALALEPSDRTPLRIPKGAVQVDAASISFPLPHRARHANLLFQKMARGNDFYVLSPTETSELTGTQYEEEVKDEVNGLKTILVKWSFIEPVDENARVTTRDLRIYSKDDVLYVTSTGIQNGDVAKVVDGVLILKVARLPKEIIHKLRRIVVDL